MNPGIYLNISNEDYHAGPGISKSGLDQINKSPAHYFSRYLDPSRPGQSDPTPAQFAGTLAHCAILERDQFDKRYAVGPDVSRVTKEWKAFEAELPAGVIGIKPDQAAQALAQAEAIKRLPDVAEAFAAGNAEASAYWRDKETGVLCKCRPDFAHEAGDGGVILFDLKTTTDAGPQEFPRSIAKWRYHVQAAWYSDGYKLATGRDVLGYVFVAVENEWPHFASAVMVDEDAMAEGRTAYRRNLNTYARCIESGTWPGYSTAIETIALPSWAITQP
jgi:exodeoxyribonuclease VIII